MALKYTQKTEHIPFADGDFVTVRGLGLPDISNLVDVHAQTAVEIFNRFTGRANESFTIDDAATLAQELLVKFPAVVAHVIALAADVPDQIDIVSKLPTDVQIAALEKIGRLTFQMQGGLGNFVETVTRLVKGANGLGKKLPDSLISLNGSTASTDR